MRPDFSRRSIQAELMDSDAIGYEEFRDCLRTLERINILTLAYRPTLRWLKGKIRSGAGGVTIWDAGSGGGDMLRRLWKAAGREGAGVTLVGIDINPWSKQAADEVTPRQSSIQFVTANVFEFQNGKPDYIISSLFTHHLNDNDLVHFLRWMDVTALKGWFINDLHRHPLPYYFIKGATALFTRNRLIRHDAPVSVARSFTRRDWQRLMDEAGIPENRYFIRWHFPFRYCVGRR